MVRQGTGGVIVSISSLSRQGNVGQTNYSAAKAGVVAMTRTWAMELADTASAPSPSPPASRRPRWRMAMPEEARQRLTDAIPLRRMAEPAEVSHAVRFVLENDFINGRVHRRSTAGCDCEAQTPPARRPPRTDSHGTAIAATGPLRTDDGG